MKIAIRGGHNENVRGASGIVDEVTENRRIYPHVIRYLREAGHTVYDVTPTSTSTQAEDLNYGVSRANQENVDLFLSIHLNASNGAGQGTEAWYYQGSIQGKVCAEAISKRMAELGFTNRGAKASTTLYELSRTRMPAVIVECFFCDNQRDVDLYRQVGAEAIGLKIAQGIDPAGVSQTDGTGTSILASPRATVAQAKAWAAQKGASDIFVNLADLFWRIAPGAGVDPVVAYTQSAKETAYGRFTGVLDESYRNPGAIKTAAGGGDQDRSAHQAFGTWEEGVQAQVDHLALYAGAAGYPKIHTPDPRHFAFLKGTARTVEQLGGRWAPSTSYGTEIVRMMEELIGTRAAEKTREESIVDNMLADGVIRDREHWLLVLTGQKQAVPEHLKTVFERYHQIANRG